MKFFKYYPKDQISAAYFPKDQHTLNFATYLKVPPNRRGPSRENFFYKSHRLYNVDFREYFFRALQKRKKGKIFHNIIQRTGRRIYKEREFLEIFPKLPADLLTWICKEYFPINTQIFKRGFKKMQISTKKNPADQNL